MAPSGRIFAGLPLLLVIGMVSHAHALPGNIPTDTWHKAATSMHFSAIDIQDPAMRQTCSTSDIQTCAQTCADCSKAGTCAATGSTLQCGSGCCETIVGRVGSVCTSPSCCLGVNVDSSQQATPNPCTPSKTTTTQAPNTTKSPSTTPVSASVSTAPTYSPSAPPVASSPSSSPKPTPQKCFPADALVELESGASKRMDRLEIGDRVKVGPNTFSDVFMFTHKNPDTRSDFVVLGTLSGHQLLLSPGHYIYVNGALVSSSSVQIGDHVTLGSGEASTVVSVAMMEGRGLYNPQTVHGDVVVNGVVTSTYTTAVSPAFGHLWLAPVRAMYKHLGLGSMIWADGADSLASQLPSGPSRA